MITVFGIFVSMFNRQTKENGRLDDHDAPHIRKLGTEGA
jgi:hypothetical protein